MKQKEFKHEGDELELLREAWQAQEQRVRELPGLDDEELKQLFADFRKEYGEVPPLTARRSQRWQQVLTAVACLVAAGCCAVACARMWDDMPYRLLLGVTATGSALCAVWCVYPYSWILFRQYRRERFETARVGKRPSPAGYAIRCVLPLAATAFAIICIATLTPVGDGYHIAMLQPGRLGAVANVTTMITHLA